MRALVTALRHDTRAVAAVEFAITLPFLLGVGLMGLETANRAMVQMQVAQLAVLVADNASRIGERSLLEDSRIYEDEINDLFHGAHLQGGNGIDLFEHGRVILSSLEVVPDTDDQQYIHWQRCMGTKEHVSSYGEQGDGRDRGQIDGMGPAGQEVVAFDDSAVMFVEIAYDYQPIIGAPFGIGDQEINVIASFIVRDTRDLSQIYQRNPDSPDDVADCASYETSTYATG